MSFISPLSLFRLSPFASFVVSGFPNDPGGKDFCKSTAKFVLEDLQGYVTV
jgi:hypothetical protein